MPSKIFKYWAPAVFWACLIFYLSSLPNLRAPLSEYSNSDKFMHAVEYFIFGFLLARLTVNTEFKLFSPYVLAFLIAFTYGGADELHQYFVPGRQCSLWDFLVDGIGGSLGAYIYSLRYSLGVRHQEAFRCLTPFITNGEN